MISAPGAFVAGAVLCVLVLWDAFEAIILPRRVTRQFRLTRFFYQNAWRLWRVAVKLIPSQKLARTVLGVFGPISLLILVAIWALGLVLGFALMQFGAGSALNVTGATPSFWTDLYLSGTTFFTLGLGDVIPRSSLARAMVVAEAGFGFGFLAAVIGYLPFIYGSFSKREVNISLLDARAGTPPTAGELLRRHGYPHGQQALRELLKDWELWSAELMESHLSYPVLAFFRSQHDNQSWIASLTAILDTCSLLMVGIDGACERQAELTFAMARHAAVDLSQVFGIRPLVQEQQRLTPEDLTRIREKLCHLGMKLKAGPEADHKLQELRRMYEPYLQAMADYLLLSLPAWLPPKNSKDNWQTTAWGRAAGLSEESIAVVSDDHF